MALKGQAKTDYQREYMRRYMREKRAKERKWRVHLRSPVVIKREAVKTQCVKTLKMGFEPKLRAELDADGNAMPGEL